MCWITQRLKSPQTSLTHAQEDVCKVLFSRRHVHDDARVVAHELRRDAEAVRPPTLHIWRSASHSHPFMKRHNKNWTLKIRSNKQQNSQMLFGLWLNRNTGSETNTAAAHRGAAKGKSPSLICERPLTLEAHLRTVRDVCA